MSRTFGLEDKEWKAACQRTLKRISEKTGYTSSRSSIARVGGARQQDGTRQSLHTACPASARCAARTSTCFCKMLEPVRVLEVAE